MSIWKRWNAAWVDDPYYHTNLGRIPPEKEWEEEQKRRRKDLEEQQEDK